MFAFKATTINLYGILRQHAGFKRYLKNTSWLFLGKFFSMAVSFLTTVYLVRYLGPANFGILNYSVSLVGMFAFLSSMGMENILYRELIGRPQNRDSLLGTTFVLKLFGGTLAFISIFVLLFFLKNELFVQHIILIVAFAYLLQPFSIVSYYFQSIVKSRGMAISSMAIVIILAAGKLSLIYFSKGLYYFALLLLLEPVLYGLSYYFLYKKEGLSFLSWRFNFSLAKEILHDSWPLVFSIIFYVVYSRIDQVMLKHYLGEYYVGIYAVAAQLSEYWYFIPAAIVSSLLPAIINAKTDNDGKYKKRLSRLMIFIVSIAFLAATFCMFFGDQLITVIYGKEYLPAVPVLKIYVWAGIGMSVGIISNQFLIVEKRTKLLFFASFISMLINVILNLLLIPRFGMNGAAFATLISYLVVPMPMFFYLKFKK